MSYSRSDKWTILIRQSDKTDFAWFATVGPIKRLKTVLVGCGSISKNWLSACNTHPNIELVGLVDLNRETALARAEQYELDSSLVYTDLATCIQERGARVIFDCTVPPAHRTVVLTAIDHGCNVFGEKPLAESIPDARAMVNAAEKAGVTYGVMQNRRWHPSSIKRVRKALDQGHIGTPHTFHADFFIGAHFGGFRDEMKHVLLLDMAIHSFDQIRALTNAMPEFVWAKDWNPPGSWYADGASAVVFFEHENNIHSTYRGSWCAEGLDTSWQCEWRIIGSRGTLLWDGNDDIRVEQVIGDSGFRRDTQTVEIPPMETTFVNGHEPAIHNFVDSILAGESPATPASDNIHSLAMVHGAIQSAETGKQISIPGLLAGNHS